MKNTKKAFNREQMKNDAKDKKEVCPAIRMTRDFLDQNVAVAWNFMLVMIVMQAEDNERREKNLEEAKKITIENDPSLPKPDTVGFYERDTEGEKNVSAAHLKWFFCLSVFCPSMFF